MALLLFVALIFTVGEANAENGRFNGLWRKHCKDKVGLQIENFEADLYFVSFCGRGGCMPPTKDRPDTTVEGDPNYNVIDDDHIQILEDDEWKDYIKCRRI